MAASINYVIIPFEGSINYGYQTGIINDLQAKKEIDK